MIPLLLSESNLEAYLRQGTRLPSGPVIITPLSGGVSARVFRVESASGICVVKQACEQLRVKDEWFSDPARAEREFLFLELFYPWLPEGCLTRPLWLDRDNHILAMEAAAPPAAPWKQDLLAGSADPALARKAGALLGLLHLAGWKHRQQLLPLADKSFFQQLRLEPFHERLITRRPELRPRLAPLIAWSMESLETLCHGDFSPKNLLQSPAGLTLVDHETAHLGDGAMDVGFFLCHLFLKSIRAENERAVFQKLVRIFLAEYESQIVSTDLLGPQFRSRALDHFAVTVLTRVEGTSPVDYLDDRQKEIACDKALEVLGKRLNSWDFLDHPVAAKR